MNKKNNFLTFSGRKGTVIHWIVFGMLAALAFFLIFSDVINVATEPIGKLSIDYTHNNLFVSELNILEIESESIKLSNEVHLQMAKIGGFDKELGPDYEKSYYLWNRENENLFPDVKTNYVSLLKKKLTKKYLELKIKEIKLEQGELIVKAEPLSIDTTKNQEKSTFTKTANKIKTIYTYNPSFRIKVNTIPFTEYSILRNEAVQLISSCKSKKDIYTCLKEKKKSHWKVGDCKKEVFLPIKNREVSFCVESPQSTKIKNYEGVEQPLQYHLSLTFKGGLFDVEFLDSIQYPTDKIYDITFKDRNPKVNKFVLYYTNWEVPTDKLPASPKSIFFGFSTGFGLFKESVELNPKNCPPAKIEPEIAYICNGFISYRLPEERSNLFFGVAQILNGQEQKISNFVKAEVSDVELMKSDS